MILHLGERVYWGAPEVIYLEGTIIKLDEDAQSILVHIDRATPNSAHLIGTDIAFFADGLSPLKGDSPPGVTSERNTERTSVLRLSDDGKIRNAAAVAVHQKYGYTLPSEQERAMIDQVAQVINDDPEMRNRIIASMDEIFTRENPSL